MINILIGKLSKMVPTLDSNANQILGISMAELEMAALPMPLKNLMHNPKL
jgi:hypothetical protein